VILRLLISAELASVANPILFLCLIVRWMRLFRRTPIQSGLSVIQEIMRGMQKW